MTLNLLADFLENIRLKAFVAIPELRAFRAISVKIILNVNRDPQYESNQLL